MELEEPLAGHLTVICALAAGKLCGVVGMFRGHGTGIDAARLSVVDNTNIGIQLEDLIRTV